LEFGIKIACSNGGGGGGGEADKAERRIPSRSRGLERFEGGRTREAPRLARISDDEKVAGCRYRA